LADRLLGEPTGGVRIFSQFISDVS
jgi:hypothetical protein